MTLTKADIIDSIYNYCGCSKTQSIGLLEALLETMKKTVDADGNKLVSYQARPGYRKVSHPNMKAGLRPIFVPEKIAKDIEAVFGVSDLNKRPTIKQITKEMLDIITQLVTD